MATARHPKATFFVQRHLFSGLNSFAELEQKIAALPEEFRGAAFEVFAEAYLATQRKHDAAQVWPLATAPSDVLHKIALPLDDYGVDGVLQTTLGQIDAYQVKFRTNRPALQWNKDKLANFVGLADSSIIHSRILFTNSDKLPSVMNKRRGFFCIRGSDLDRLEASDFRAIEAWLADAAFIAPKKLPQPHQTEALNALLPALQTEPRISAIMACGTGKTLVALWVAEHIANAGGASVPASRGELPQESARQEPRPTNAACKILVLLPSLALLRQTLHEWLRETRLPSLAYLCVCSDPTVKEGIDALTTQQSDLDFQVTTDTASVRSFLDVPFAGVKMIFSTYESAHKIGAAMQPGEAFDFAVFDEAHKTAGREGRKNAFALEDANLLIRKRLFLTATPRHIDIRHRNKDGEFKVQSMDDAAVYGSRAFTLSFAAAAKKGIICRYKVIISLIDKRTVSDFARKHGITLVKQDEISARWVANLIAVKQAVEKVEARKIITFHSRVKMADEFAAHGSRGIADQLNGYDVRHVNGAQSTMERSKIIHAFADAPKSVLTNARCLTEGVDIPAVDMVAFIDPRQSRVDIAQAVGRAMRKPRGQTTKTVGYVVVPLFAGMDERDNLEEAVHGEKFDVVADVLNALQEHDEEFVEIIREIKERKGRGEPFDPRQLNEKVQTIGPLVELDRLSASIVVEIGDRIGVSWDEWFGVLQLFKTREHHCLVPVGYREGTYKLGRWVHNQRSQRDKIHKERRQRLDALGFDWDPMAAAWEEGFAALQKFHEKEHHCRIPTRYIEGTFRLGEWVSAQRRQRDSIPVERRQRLELLDFDWNRYRFRPALKDGFAALEQFKAREGHCRVPLRHIEGTFRLGKWLQLQRRQKETVTAETRQRLDALGFDWYPLATAWEEGFAALEQFKARERHCRVPLRHIEGTFRLGGWVGTQRTERDTIPVERRQRLELIGFEWDPFASNWEQGFATLQKFHAREQHCRVSARHFEGTYRLGSWVSHQRRKRDIMPIERRQKLEALNFEWDILVSVWEEGFAVLEQFKAREGHCRVPQRYHEGTYQLGQWVATQRKQKDNIPVERRQRLDALGFIWNTLVAAWEEGFAALQKFHAREHHCLIPGNHNEETFRLGQWVGTQRKQKNSMPVERRQRLDALGFTWRATRIPLAPDSKRKSAEFQASPGM